MPLKRRQFLVGSAGLCGLSLVGHGGLASLPWLAPAMAADVGGYRALVCLFMLGGLDCHDTVLPYDEASYDEYAAIRSELLARYASTDGGSTRERSRLLPLASSNIFGGREFALPEELSGIKGLYDAGNAAIVGNVGPLILPVTRSSLLDESAVLPKRLFSHNDQQSTWASSAPEGAQFGWGGRFADAALAAGGNSQRPEFTAITTLADRLFVTGEQAVPYHIGENGAARLQALEALQSERGTAQGEARYQLLREHFLASGFSSENLLSSDYQAAMVKALTSNELYDAALADAPQIDTPFPQGSLGGQLGAVARSIAASEALGVNRQVFFVALGGFDTHSNQVQQLPRLQREIDAAVSAFFDAMQELQVADEVTLFSASDFGRTLTVNGDGTDHGWAGHHFVVGGAVNGGDIYGAIPEATLDHSQDAGGGRLIPTVSVEQYSAPLGRWFGLNDSELNLALPNLAGQGGSDLTFI